MLKSWENTHCFVWMSSSSHIFWDVNSFSFGNWLYNLSIMLTWELLYVLISGARLGTWLKLSPSPWLLMFALSSVSFHDYWQPSFLPCEEIYSALCKKKRVPNTKRWRHDDEESSDWIQGCSYSQGPAISRIFSPWLFWSIRKYSFINSPNRPKHIWVGIC